MKRIDGLNTKRKLLVSAALKFLQALSIALIAFMRDALAIVLLLVIGRFGATLSVSASKAAQAELGSGTKEFGKRQSFFSLGNSIGPFIGGITYKALSEVGAASLSLIVVSALMFASSLILLKTSKVIEGS